MKTVYLLLTRTTTVFSRVIRLLTAAPYTHAALSTAQNPAEIFLSEPNQPSPCSRGFYSFGRKNPYLPFPAGFTMESGFGGYIRAFPHTNCALMSLEIPDDSYEQICTRLARMEKCTKYYHYNLLGALLCGIGLPVSRRRRYFCSQFVADLLSRSGAVDLPKPVDLMRPVDFAFLCGAKVVYIGTTGEMLARFSSAPALPPPLPQPVPGFRLA